MKTSFRMDTLAALLVLTGIVSLVPAGAAQTEEADADQVVARYVTARGGLDRLKSVNTVRVTGTMELGPGVTAPFVLEMKRPNKMRLDTTVQGQTGSQAFDGTVGWVLMPFAGINEPDVMSGETARDAQAQADFDGPLVDYKAKGNRVELAAREKTESGDAYRLKVTLKDGSVRDVYLSADSFLETKSETTRSIHGVAIQSETRLSNYKSVEGVLFPFLIENGITGVPNRQKMTIDRIEVNAPIDDGRFSVPQAQKPA